MTRRPRMKPYRPSRTEAQVLSAVLDALRCDGVEPARHNVGAARNASGQLVMFGRKGDADIQTMIPAGWGSASGRSLHIETKRESFDPRWISGRAREQFPRQVERLKAVNTAGGYGFWVRDANEVIHALTRIRAGRRVEIDSDGWPYLVNDLAGEQGRPRALSIPEEVEPFN